MLYLRNPCENTFSKLQIFVFFIKQNVQNILGYWPYATHKKIFLYIFVETQTSQLDAPWLEPLRGPNGLDLRRLKKTSKWKVASYHAYYKNYKKLETIRNKNPSKPNQLKIL